MLITVNNTNHKIEAESSISMLLNQLEKTENGIAVAINNNVIPKTEWTNKTINENDNILIIQATQGG